MATCVDAIHQYRVQTAETYRDPIELRTAQDCKIDGRSSRAAFKKRVYCQLNNLASHNRNAGARYGKEAEAQDKIRERAGVEVVLVDDPDETDDDGLIQDDVPQTYSRIISKEWLQQNMEQWEDECNEELAAGSSGGCSVRNSWRPVRNGAFRDGSSVLARVCRLVCNGA